MGAGLGRGGALWALPRVVRSTRRRGRTNLGRRRRRCRQRWRELGDRQALIRQGVRRCMSRCMSRRLRFGQRRRLRADVAGGRGRTARRLARTRSHHSTRRWRGAIRDALPTIRAKHDSGWVIPPTATAAHAIAVKLALPLPVKLRGREDCIAATSAGRFSSFAHRRVGPSTGLGRARNRHRSGRGTRSEASASSTHVTSR